MSHFLPLPLVMLVTDRTVVKDGQMFFRTVDQAVAGGVNAVQLREKDLPDADQLELAKGLRVITKDRALLFINDSLSVAEAAGADGVQLTEASRSVADVRHRATNRSLLIGRSVHDVDGAVLAERQGAGFLIAGAVYPTATHPDQSAAGTELVRDIAGAVSIPVLGIGGINPNNAADVIAAGASGVAVIRGVLAAEDCKEAAGQLASAVRTAWALREPQVLREPQDERRAR